MCRDKIRRIILWSGRSDRNNKGRKGRGNEETINRTV
jgi:hypothetical protein